MPFAQPVQLPGVLHQGALPRYQQGQLGSAAEMAVVAAKAYHRLPNPSTWRAVVALPHR